MLIEVNKDVIEQACNDSAQSINYMAEFLRELSIAVYRKKHLIFVPCLSDVSLRNKLEKVIGQQSTSLLALSLNHRADVGRVKELLTDSVLISNNPSLTLPNNVILINPLDCQHFEVYQETHIITENLTDSQFFEYIIRFYLKENNINQISHNFYPLMGGGATAANVLKAEVKLSHHFVVAIADSDKHYPSDDFGPTYLSMKKVMDEESPKYAKLYVMDSVSEIENLIPHKFLRNHSEYTENHEDIFDTDSAFYDIKKGYNIQSLWNDDIANYWRSIFPGKDFEKRDNHKRQFPVKRDYDSEAKLLRNNKVIEYCWGNRILENTIEQMNLDEISSNDLTVFQYKEWKQIGQLLFSWSCSLHAGIII